MKTLVDEPARFLDVLRQAWGVPEIMLPEKPERGNPSLGRAMTAQRIATLRAGLIRRVPPIYRNDREENGVIPELYGTTECLADMPWAQDYGDFYRVPQHEAVQV